jgi:hypothetical protein
VSRSKSNGSSPLVSTDLRFPFCICLPIPPYVHVVCRPRRRRRSKAPAPSIFAGCHGFAHSETHTSVHHRLRSLRGGVALLGMELRKDEQMFDGIVGRPTRSTSDKRSGLPWILRNSRYGCRDGSSIPLRSIPYNVPGTTFPDAPEVRTSLRTSYAKRYCLRSRCDCICT